jgi:ketosteroid isomerase-like protein
MTPKKGERRDNFALVRFGGRSISGGSRPGIYLWNTPDYDTDYRRVSPADDERIVAALDTEYQAAVKKNNAETMDRILADDFVIVTGLGKTYTKADLLEEARSKRMVYEHQEDSAQKVRVWGDTAVVTALLWAKGTEDGKTFDYKLWFSDTYVRSATGWRYVFAQSSTRLPTTP